MVCELSSCWTSSRPGLMALSSFSASSCFTMSDELWPQISFHFARWILKEFRRRRSHLSSSLHDAALTCTCGRRAHALMSPQTRVCLMQRTDCRQRSADWWTSAHLIFWEALFKHVPDLLPNNLITASLRLLLLSKMFFSSLFVAVQLF